MSRTKIVCTIGPASEKEATLKKMILAGMRVARLNFSHGTHEQHQGFIETIRGLSASMNIPVAIMQDLQGPKIRVGALPAAGLKFGEGKTVHFSPKAKEYNDRDQLIPVTYGGFARDVKAHDRVMIDDGNVVCRVTAVHKGTVSARVEVGGLVTSHKGVNLPDSSVRLSALTAKDQKDVAFGVRAGVDMIVLSFVSNGEDLSKLRELIKREEKRQGIKPSNIEIVAKVERADAIHHIDDIIEEADAIMLGRGDLGVEIPAEQVPLHQKEIVHKCRCAGVPVIVATQMLESMRDKPRATRAEVSDVANAVIDHTDAIMLSAESATGKYPVKAVETLVTVAEATEASVYSQVRPDQLCVDETDMALVDQIRVAMEGDKVEAIVSGMQFGDVALTLNRHRPQVPIFIAAVDDKQARQLSLCWGVTPFVLKRARSADAFQKAARAALEEQKLIKKTTQLLFITGA
ncbi:pyruvate kinase [Candidatus Uhrbacteria bacterium CG10_big_fil_rev_8_21_14_0_10_50_16]|uniref:Pyruvate kinase n=1 Tax=Candidatus Uhrbacteria bacterium CG10_big_fil_rev_8_21_14_0_10_50_16 TaxID=1975039 RepID=A0A2H0RM87_9BACT|nr:MAG: pyruvate kinase [Candidatus Uhrbacteria bacterium CG10_big_fil_rev_8_21_14_0_10_50_16]